jgi:glucose-1-phosphate cytidylyltransferase
MKVIILAGGLGSRLSEYTENIPKPMVTVGGKPILWHIMNRYAKYGFTDFYLALGYKAEVIKEYFLNYRNLNSDFTINLSTGSIYSYQENKNDWKVTLIDTGKETMTGGRVKRMQSFIENETFLLTYGDGVADINIDELIKFHKSHGKMVTVSAVRPSARFGELDIDKGLVTAFQEKPQTKHGWINGGYFVIEPEFFDFIKDDKTILEKEPLERVSAIGQLMAYHHHGFWQCMDTKREKDILEDLWKSLKAPWSY